MSEEDFNNLDEDDLRVKYKNLQISENYNKFKLNILIENSSLIENNIDYCEINFNGLILYNKPFNINNDNYQTLYNYISEKASINISKIYPEYYDHIDIYDHLKILKINKIYDDEITINSEENNNEFFKKIYHIVLNQFGNMNNYHSDNITYYSYIYIPKLKDLINYINNISNTCIKKILKEIKNENINNNYFNSVNHHLIITPFILNYNLPQDILNIIKEIEELQKEAEGDKKLSKKDRKMLRRLVLAKKLKSL